MVVGADGTWPLPWLARPLMQALHQQRGHALLVHGAPGAGALAMALTLAQAWLCEGPGGATGEDPRPCGRCAGCRLVQAHLHPDLTVLLPETLRRAHEWPLPDDRTDDDKRKPSRQIRIGEVRHLVDRATRTSARGRAKVALLHPAEALNAAAANALLKTLEEPPPGTRLVLSCGDPALLLPTLRSRCQRLTLAPPAPDVALDWLEAQGMSDRRDARLLLAACSGRPLDVLELAGAGVDGARWSALPDAVARGDAQALAGWPVPRAVDALQKICHDALADACGGAPRYFAPGSLRPHGRIDDLIAWWQTLNRVARHDEHPWHEALLVESLVQQGAAAWRAPAGKGTAAARDLDTLGR